MNANMMLKYMIDSLYQFYINSVSKKEEIKRQKL